MIISTGRYINGSITEHGRFAINNLTELGEYASTVTASTVFIKVGTVWKECTVYIKVSGQWITPISMYAKVDGEWV